MSRALRCRSVIPPQIPNSTLLSSASAAHSRITGQCRQITAALRWAAPRTNSSSGSVSRHSALVTHARSPASAARGVLATGTRFSGREACPVAGTELSLSSRPRVCDRLADAGTCATCARVCDLDPPSAQGSGSVSIAQRFFGTDVPFLASWPEYGPRRGDGPRKALDKATAADIGAQQRRSARRE